MHSLSCRVAGTPCCRHGYTPRQKTKISLLLSIFPPSVMSAHPNVPPVQTAALTDSACPSSPWQRGRDRQSVSDSLCTWPSRGVQLEWNHCLLCSVCNGSSAASFPIHTPSGFPSPQQLSQLLNSIPYDIILKIILFCSSSFLPLSSALSFPLPSSTHPLQGTRGSFCFYCCMCAGCSVWVACCPDRQRAHTAALLYMECYSESFTSNELLILTK